MSRGKFTLENNFDEVREKILNNTQYAKSQIGRALVKEIRPQINRQFNIPRRMFLRATLQSWARFTEGDIIIGYKDPEKISFLRGKNIDYSKMAWHYDQVDDPIKPTVVKNIPMMQRLIAEGLMHKADRGRSEWAKFSKDEEP